MTKSLLIRNTSAAGVSMPELGVTVAAGATYDIFDAGGANIRLASSLFSRILDGTFLLIRTESPETYFNTDEAFEFLITYNSPDPVWQSAKATLLPYGSASNRPTLAKAGMIRYNVDFAAHEYYDGTTWRQLQDRVNVSSVGTGSSLIAGVSSNREILIRSITGGGNVDVTVVGNNINVSSRTTIATASAIGGGASPIVSVSSTELILRTFVGSNIEVSARGNNIVISALTQNVTLSSLGGGTSLAIGVSANREIQIRSLTAGGIIDITQVGNTVNISARQSPQTLSALGGGISPVIGVSGNELQFRTFTGGGNVDITQVGNTINVSSRTTIATASAIGGGVSPIVSVSSTELILRTFVGSNIEVSARGNNIVISALALTMQQTYNNSTSPELVLDNTRGAITIRNNSTPITGPLFEVQNNAGTVNYGIINTQGIGFPTGTEAAPGLFVIGDTNAGINSPAADTIQIVTNGSAAVTTNPQGRTGFGGINADVRVDIDGGFAIRPAASVVNITTSSQSISVDDRSYIRLTSNNATASNRNFTLQQSTRAGQVLVLEWANSNAGILFDNVAQTGGGNVRLYGDWIPSLYDTLTLISNGTDWVELSRGEAKIILDNAAVQVRRTTTLTQVVTATQTITWSTTDIQNDTTILEWNGSTLINIKETGLYQILYDADLEVPNANSMAQWNFWVTQNGSTVLVGSSAFISNMRATTTGTTLRNHVSQSFIANLTNGDNIRLDVNAPTTGASATSSILPNATMKVIRLRSRTAVASRVIKTFHFTAANLDSPNNSNWAVNALAPAIADPTNNALIVRAFDDTLEEGVGYYITIPENSKQMNLHFKWRRATGTAAQNLVWRLYYREIPNNGAITSWSNVTLTTQAAGTNTNYQYRNQLFNIPDDLALNIGSLYQFELVRLGPNASDTLVGDAYLIEYRVEFLN